ncbi:metallophosphoesterase family protein [Phycicoccus flavus]|uniref:metallophosphoesterase family protein n=1 Tax=Phycicoccus flavus TaxID=2502783 RepID=UPI000FEB90A4|nr:metallophosphoesterase [Phycicoccus flavus]NHA67657.1 alkaline phosphatase [Phycicoccus flavus]
MSDDVATRTRRPRTCRHVRVMKVGGVLAAVAVAALAAGCGSPAPPRPASPSSASAGTSTGPAPSTSDASETAAADGAVSGVAVGDIVCEAGDEPSSEACRQQDTADLAAGLHPRFVLALGDLQYQQGALDQFEAAWRPSWGRFDDILAPVPGNHEYETPDAAGYTAYFHTPPWSVRTIGSWRVYLLDSDCDHVDCGAEAAWLAADLAAHPTTCSAITMHHPRVSSGPHGDNEMVQPLWQAAVDGGVDLALMGHDHDYERFAHLDASGAPTDPDRGIREFVVGTGGRSLYHLGDRKAGSEFSQDSTFGVLDLTLEDGAYSWSYVALGGDVLDSGSDSCRA